MAINCLEDASAEASQCHELSRKLEEAQASLSAISREKQRLETANCKLKAELFTWQRECHWWKHEYRALARIHEG
jgi:hypothetical protein